mmetsp:Transcript_85408/g.217695  ORF Transcript_85408/g.217695 Transcript_85408/m.217695 type:complete len:206 (-) Transcript_85408:612-1229(-)
MTLEVPPGACRKRGAASGVATGLERRAWRSAKSCLLSSLPSTTPSAPPMGPRTVTSAPCSVSPPRQMVEVPPGTWAKRGAAAGVSVAWPRCSSYGRKDSEASPPPKTMLATPPTGRGDAAATGASAAPPRTIVEVPPGAWGKRGAASGVSMPAERCWWNSAKTAPESSLPNTRLEAPPTAPRIEGDAEGAPSSVLRLKVVVPPGA